MFFSRATPAPAALPPADIDGVPVRVSSRSRRMALRVEARTGRVVLSLPAVRRWTPQRLAAARGFIAQNREWIVRHDAPVADNAALQPGDSLTVGDATYTLAHQPGRGLSRFDGETIVITGNAAYFARRLRDFLKKHAQDVLTARTQEKCAQLGLPPRAVTLRDPATRWGSCGPDGRIMYSWRLILVPDWVLDYVVAHEVAHRVHLDHSRAFWRLCLSLTPRGTEARRWLRAHGAGVMRL